VDVRPQIGEPARKVLPACDHESSEFGVPYIIFGPWLLRLQKGLDGIRGDIADEPSLWAPARVRVVVRHALGVLAPIVTGRKIEVPERAEEDLAVAGAMEVGARPEGIAVAQELVD